MDFFLWGWVAGITFMWLMSFLPGKDFACVLGAWTGAIAYMLSQFA